MNALLIVLHTPKLHDGHGYFNVIDKSNTTGPSFYWGGIIRHLDLTRHMLPFNENCFQIPLS